jgi:hypothetical protein
MLYPRDSHALYLDSGSKLKEKNYSLIKSVLNEAMDGYIRAEGYCGRLNQVKGKYAFRHRTEFPCPKQAPGGQMEAWYLVQHMLEVVKEQQSLQFMSAVDKWCRGIVYWSDAEFRQNFGRIQRKLCTIIYRDVVSSDGAFYSRCPLPNDELLQCVLEQGDERPFNSLEGALPFPPMKKKITTTKK